MRFIIGKGLTKIVREFRMTNYDRDLTIWAKNTAQLLRERRWDAIDWDHLIEEVEDLGKVNEARLLLKWNES